MQATDIFIINNYPNGEVAEDMFESKRANEILLSEIMLLRICSKSLKKVRNLNLRFQANQALQSILLLNFDERVLNLLHEGVSNMLKYCQVKPGGGKAYRFRERLCFIL
ncbi:MAG: hypothetical protein J6P14_05615 [Ruminococcus sp.]|nr:hypothetical protein [Ruminococcus sp.]